MTVARHRPTIAIIGACVAALVVCLGLGGAEAVAAPGSSCPHGFNRDGSCRAEPFAPPSRPTRQRVTVRSEPPGAAIFIDGEPLLTKDGSQAVTDYTHKGKLPAKLSLIELRLSGYEPAKIWARIERYGRQEIEHRLVPLVPVKVHNLTDVACQLEVERIEASNGADFDQLYAQQGVTPVSPASEDWVSLRRRVLPARTTITMQLAGPGRYELDCSADSYQPQCTTVDLSLADAEWSVVQIPGCGSAVGGATGRRDGSVDVRLEPREACVQIDPDVPDVPLQVWTMADPRVGCGEPPDDVTVGSQWWSRRASACGSEQGVPHLEGAREPAWGSLSARRGGSSVGRGLGLVEYGGARYGDTVCIRAPAITGWRDVAVRVDGLNEVVGLTLWPVDDLPEPVALRPEGAAAANERCVDETLPAPERARECAHLAFLIESGALRGRARERRRVRRLRSGGAVPSDSRQLWARACEGGDARACEAAGILARQCRGEGCSDANSSFERACELGRRTACIRRVSSWADGAGLESLYRLVGDRPPSSVDPPDGSRRLASKGELDSDRSARFFVVPAVQLGFDPRDFASSWQIEASWFNYFVRSKGGVFGGWLKGLVPSLVSFEQRVVEDGMVSTRRVYGGQLGVFGIARAHAELLRRRPTEVLLFASAGVGYGLAFVDGFRLSGDALAGVGLTINGWGLDAGVRTLRAPYTRTELDGRSLRSSVPRLGVYVSLETNFDLRRR